MKLKWPLWGGNGAKEEAHVASLGNGNDSHSSMVNATLSHVIGVRPEPSFDQRYEFYYTVGKVWSSVESYIKGINKRDFYFAPTGPEEKQDDRGVKLMNEFEVKYDLAGLLEYVARDWMVAGNNLIGKSDYLPVQITTIDRMVRDKWGNPTAFIARIGSKDIPLDPEKFIFSKYIDVNREAWGKNMFYALTTTFIDIDGQASQPSLSIYRQMEQDNAKIYHKFASPRVLYTTERPVTRSTFNKIVDILKNWKPGERKFFDRKLVMQTETIDTQTRFVKILEHMNEEVESGLQSSASRLLTRPSAMADAREARKVDTDTLLDLMEKLRRFVNFKLIPVVLQGNSIDPNSVEFRWGSADSFDIEYPQGLKDVVDQNVVRVDEAREILKSKGWKLTDNPPPAPSKDESVQEYEIVDQEGNRWIIRKRS